MGGRIAVGGRGGGHLSILRGIQSRRIEKDGSGRRTQHHVIRLPCVYYPTSAELKSSVAGRSGDRLLPSGLEMISTAVDSMNADIP